MRQKVLGKTTREIQRRVRRTHRGLGHPSRATMLKMMRLGGASPAAITYAKYWNCPICKAASQPSAPLNASTRIRPYKFIHTVAVDLKYLKDSGGNNHVALLVVDAGTAFQGAVLLRNRTSDHVVNKFLEMWIQHYGVPELIIADLGGEFEGEWNDTTEEYGIDSRAAGAHAPWQNGIAERHGKILGGIWDKIVDQFSVKGRRDAKRVLAICVRAGKELNAYQKWDNSRNGRFRTRT